LEFGLKGTTATAQAILAGTYEIALHILDVFQQ
jgi:hypothetical protein